MLHKLIELCLYHESGDWKWMFFLSLDILQVLPFGSVPLKTYLPDGDIDLTALSHEDAEEDLAQSVLNVLQSVDDPEYQVKDVQDIRAQV